jgi:hypothetical protein
MESDTPIQLPEVLLASADFVALNMHQRKSFADRIANCLELSKASQNAVDQLDADFFSLLDDIELDIYSDFGASSNVEDAVSPYRVHSSWTFECDKKALSSYMPDTVARFLSSVAFSTTWHPDDLKRWTAQLGVVLQEALVKLAESSSFTEAVAHLIAINALLAKFLVFASSVRLNPRASF